MTVEERLRWYYDVARLKGARLTEADHQRLDDYERLVARDEERS